MKRVLVILGNYSPNPSSVAICAEPLIQRLISRGYKLDIVTDRKRIDIPEYEYINPINVYRTDNYRVMNTSHLADLAKINSSKALKSITRVVSFFLKACYYIRYCMFDKEKGTAGWDLNSAAGKCVELYCKHEYDAVISFSLPFRSHYIAKQFSHKLNKPIPWAIYEYDPFSYNKELREGKRKRKKLFYDEYSIFEECDKIFLSPELYRFYRKTPFVSLVDKFVSMPYANMSPIYYTNDNDNDVVFNPDSINCLFIGRLYSDIRNPSYAIKLFSFISKDIHISLFTNFNSEQLLGDITDDEDKFTILPFQGRNTALNALMNADILINIGNTVEFQVPGKIFEYMSTGKPIIHFSKFSEDPALLYIERYPCALIINEWEDNIKEQSLQVERFCKEKKGLCFSYDEVCAALNDLSSEFVSDKFVDIVEALIKEKSKCDE